MAEATSYSVDIFAHVPGCGDSVIQTGEECDSGNFGGATCETLGFDEGTLSCSSACTFITGSCTLDAESGGGTRTTNETILPLPDTNVVVYGTGRPESTVSLLKDGQRVATIPVREDGTFQITISGLGTGTYRFQLISELMGFDPVRSEVLILRVLKSSTTKVGPIVLPDFAVNRPIDDTSFESCRLVGDVTGDCMVNTIDFFVTRFQYIFNRVSERFDFDGDGKVTIVDFSIVAFNWTG